MKASMMLYHNPAGVQACEAPPIVGPCSLAGTSVITLLLGDQVSHRVVCHRHAYDVQRQVLRYNAGQCVELARWLPQVTITLQPHDRCGFTFSPRPHVLLRCMLDAAHSGPHPLPDGTWQE